MYSILSFFYQLQLIPEHICDIGPRWNIISKKDVLPNNPGKRTREKRVFYSLPWVTKAKRFTHIFSSFKGILLSMWPHQRGLVRLEILGRATELWEQTYEMMGLKLYIGWKLDPVFNFEAIRRCYFFWKPIRRCWWFVSNKVGIINGPFGPTGLSFIRYDCMCSESRPGLVFTL